MIRDEKQPRGDRNSFSRLDFDRLNGKMRGAVAEWSVLVCPYKITKGYFLNTGHTSVSPSTNFPLAQELNAIIGRESLFVCHHFKLIYLVTTKTTSCFFFTRFGLKTSKI